MHIGVGLSGSQTRGGATLVVGCGRAAVADGGRGGQVGASGLGACGTESGRRLEPGRMGARVWRHVSFVGVGRLGLGREGARGKAESGMSLNVYVGLIRENHREFPHQIW